MEIQYNAPPSSYLIGANDEHGYNPLAPVRRTPMMPYINRRIYEYEFNGKVKRYFLDACKRAGYRVFDVKPENDDITISERRRRIEQANPSVLITFGYNAYKNHFNSISGLELYYSELNKQSQNSRKLSEYIYYRLLEAAGQNGRGVKTIDIMVTATVTMPAALIEAGFLTSLQDAKLMLDPDYQKIIGEYACAGVSDYLGVPFAPQNIPLTRPTAQKGSKGSTVKYLQEKLYAKLYDPKGFDGIFGTDTESALMAFQRENGLFANGVAESRTWAKLIPLGGGRERLS